MKLGKYEILPIKSGQFALDGGAMFGVVPKSLWEKSNPSDEKNRIPLALRSLLIKSTERIILIDTGIGNNFDQKFSSIYKIETNDWNVNHQLQSYNIKPEDITDVILTHLHFDHTGGTTYRKNGQLVLAFQNAIHHVQEEHWDWALKPSEKDQASFLQENFILLEKERMLNKLSGPCELFPGLEVMVTYGHTPGMQIVKISDSDKTLLYCADLIPTASHIPVPWVMAYDNNPMTTMNEKNRLLPQAVEENWVLVFEHDPELNAGTITRTEKGFKLDKGISLLD